MRLQHKNEDGILTVYLSGEIDHHTAAEMRERVDSLVEVEMAKKLCLDFSDVGFMDSSGVGIVLGRYKKMKGLGGELFVTGASPIIYKIFAMSGLCKLMPINEKKERGGVVCESR